MVHVRLANGHPIRVDDFRPTVSRAGSQAAVHHCRNLHVQCSEIGSRSRRNGATGSGPWPRVTIAWSGHELWGGIGGTSTGLRSATPSLERAGREPVWAKSESGRPKKHALMGRDHGPSGVLPGWEIRARRPHADLRGRPVGDPGSSSLARRLLGLAFFSGGAACSSGPRWRIGLRGPGQGLTEPFPRQFQLSAMATLVGGHRSEQKQG